MKKLLWFILAITTLIACGDSNNSDGDDSKTPPPGVNTTWLGDWNNDKDDAYKPEYEGKYNPICDEWKVVKKNGKEYTDMLLYSFSTNKYWNFATHMRTEEPFWKVEYKRSEYKINNKQLMFEDGTIFEYSLTISKTEDKLQVYDGRDRWELVPYTDSWTWKGDWNNPLNRHYTVYLGKYNPLAGTTWKYIYEDGKPVSGSSSYYYIFDKDTTLMYRSEDKINKKYTYNLAINSNSLRRHSSSSDYREYKYVIKSDTLILFENYYSGFIWEYKYLQVK